MKGNRLLVATMPSAMLLSAEMCYGLEAFLSSQDELYQNLYLVTNCGLHLPEGDGQSYFTIETGLVVLPEGGTVNAS